MILQANTHAGNEDLFCFEKWGHTDGLVNIVITTGRVWVCLVDQ